MSRFLEQELLRTTRKLQRQGLMRTIDKSQLKALSEIAYNVILHVFADEVECYVGGAEQR